MGVEVLASKFVRQYRKTGEVDKELIIKMNPILVNALLTFAKDGSVTLAGSDGSLIVCKNINTIVNIVG